MPVVSSSAIRSIEHDPAASALLVTFASGRSFRYDGVPVAVYDAFLAAPSKGRFFNAEIRDVFAYREVTVRRARGR